MSSHSASITSPPPSIEMFVPKIDEQGFLNIDNSKYRIRAMTNTNYKWYWIPLFFTGIGALFVIYKLAKKVHFQASHIKVSIGTQTHYLNISALKQRALISQNQMNDHLHKNTFWTFLKNRIYKADLSTNPGFQKLPQKIQEVFSDSLAAVDSKKALAEDDNHYYIAQYDRCDNLKIISMPKKDDVIQEGGVSIVKRVRDVTKGTFLAFKTPQYFDINNAETQAARQARFEIMPEFRDLDDEIPIRQVMEDLSTRSKFNTPEDALFGVQEPAELCLNIDLADGRKILGSVEIEYQEGDLDTWLKKNQDLPKSQLLTYAATTIKALLKWWKGGKPHGDIKSDNICIDGNKVRVIDLPRETAIEKRIYGSTYCFTAEQDYQEISEILNMTAENEEDEKRLSELFKQKLFISDVFSTGVTLFELLTKGKSPYAIYEKRDQEGNLLPNKYIDKGTPFRRELLKDMGYSETLIDAVQKMVAHNPAERTTIAQIEKIVLKLIEAEAR